MAIMWKVCKEVVMCSGESRYDIKSKIKVGNIKVGIEFLGV